MSEPWAAPSRRRGAADRPAPGRNPPAVSVRFLTRIWRRFRRDRPGLLRLRVARAPGPRAGCVVVCGSQLKPPGALRAGRPAGAFRVAGWRFSDLHAGADRTGRPALSGQAGRRLTGPLDGLLQGIADDAQKAEDGPDV